MEEDFNYSIQPDEADLEVLSRYSSHGSNLEKFEVTFEVDDIENINERLSYFRKWVIAIILSGTSVCVTMLSSAWAMASNNIMEHFNVSHEVAVLGISLFIFGLGTGPLFLSPISEFYGRKITYIFGLSLCCCFEILTAFSPNFGALLFGRFMSGFFGSAFLSVAGGTFTDIFKKNEIGVPMCVFSLAPFSGPALGPVVSAFVNAHLYWRWTFYVLLMFSGFMLLLLILFVPETYVPILLTKKAKRKRLETGDDRYYADLEIMKSENSVFMTCLTAPKRPIMLLLHDRMTFILCFYTGLILAIIYMFFVSFPYIFETVFHFKPTSQGLSFLGLLAGMLLGGSTSPYFQHLYNKKTKESGKPKSEYRLYPMMIGAFTLPTGLFIFAFTCYPQVHWIGPIIGSAVFGAGVAFLFQGVFSYTGDAYRKYSASAMSCNSLIRSYMSGIFPLFALQMYKRLGINYAGLLIALIVCLMVPCPFIFFRKGESLRAKSEYTWSED